MINNINTVDCTACNEYIHSGTALLCPQHQEEALGNHICIECGGNVVDYPMADSPDDYTIIGICNGCGASWS